MKTVLSQNSPSPNQRILNRQITSAQIKSDQKKQNSIRTEPEVHSSNNFQSNTKQQTEIQDSDLQNEFIPSLNNYLFQQEYLTHSQIQNKNTKTPERVAYDNQTQFYASQNPIKNKIQNETNYGKMGQTSNLKQRTNEQQLQQSSDVNRNKKPKEQPNSTDQMYNLVFMNSNLNIFNNQIVQNQLSNYKSKTNNNIFNYTTNNFTTNNNNNNQQKNQIERPKSFVKDSEKVSPFKITSQEHTISNFQIKSLQPNYSNQKQQIFQQQQQQKQSNIQTKKLNQTQVFDKDIIASEQFFNQKLQNKYEIVYSRKRSFTNVQPKISQQQQQE